MHIDGLHGSDHHLAVGPPPLATAIYRLILRGDDECELGDLIEEYHVDLVPTRGLAAARAWYWSQVARSIGPRLLTRCQAVGAGRLATRLMVSILALFTTVSYALRSEDVYLGPGYSVTCLDAGRSGAYAMVEFEDPAATELPAKADMFLKECTATRE